MTVTGMDLLGSPAIGTVIAQRYELKAVAGHGGMGTVFRAWDRHHDRWVALKLLLGDVRLASHAERFAREVTILAELRHPNIVAYLGHGQTKAGQPFLIMEWLEGAELAARLQRGPLGLTDSLHVISQATAALVVTHGRGFVHRDIKPSNLFLRHGSLDAVTLLDFGVARSIAQTPTLTKTGALIGTIDYMAPEQARGQRELGPEVDIYSLGCVLFECLVGRPPFVSDSLAGLFAQTLLEAAPPLRSILTWVPVEVEQLVRRMLDKDPLCRPRDAASLLTELRALGTIPNDVTTALPQRTAPQQAITGGELFLVSVVVAAPRTSKSEEEATLDLEQIVHESHQRQRLRETLRRFGANIEFFPDGTIVNTLTQGGVATDQAAQAARYALALQQIRPELRLSLATGRAELQYSVPSGEAIDRAIKQLPGSEALPGVYVDEVSAGLLGARFVIGQVGGRFVLHAERSHDEVTPLLLGQPTPCVGRLPELTLLATVLKSCIEDPRPRVVLVTAPAGGGKSRLRHEFLKHQRLQHPEVAVLFGVADPMSTGSPYATIGQLLRRLCGVLADEPLIAQQQKLSDRIGRHLDPLHTTQVVAFLGELCGIVFPAEKNSLLGAARHDPQVMDRQVQQAFIHWLAAECRFCPQLLVLEDLHWADALTVRLLDAACRELAEQPIMCLLLARGEITPLFGGLWSTRTRCDLRLGGLSRRASESLIREVLGNQLDRHTVQRIIAQSAGNALYLEELIRAAAAGKGDALPETLLAMTQAWLMRLPAPERRLLRAASVFGHTFCDNGLRALLGDEQSEAEVAAVVESLLARELIERPSVSRFPGAVEYRFRHALLRDAAYALLTDNDRQLGHRLAGAYREGAGEEDALVLAEHAERSSDHPRAARFLVHAAEQSLARNDLSAATRHAERSITISEPGNRWWYKAKTILVSLALHQAQLDRLDKLVNDFSAMEPQAAARAEYVETASWLVIAFSFLGQRKQAAAHLTALQAAVALHEDTDRKSRGVVGISAAWYERLLTPRPHSALMWAQKAVHTLELVQDHRQLALSQLVLALSWVDLGNAAAGQAMLRQSLLWMEKRGDLFMVTSLNSYLAMLLAPSEDEAERHEAEALCQSVLAVSPSSIPGGMSRMARAQLRLVAGELEAAAAEAHQAIILLGGMRPFALRARAILIEILLKQERYLAASALAVEALQIKNDLGLSGGQVVFLLVRCAETYHALGDPVHAHDTLCDIMEQLHLRLDDIPDVLAKRRFLTQVPENARALALARSWLGDSTSHWLTEPSWQIGALGATS